MNYTDPNNFSGSDIEKINAAVLAAKDEDGIVRIGRRKSNDGRNFWLIDSAILLPENTTLIISNTKIKLSDISRDNFVRSANCIVGNKDVPDLENIHIIGEGNAIFEGADHPRATGDGGKTLTIGRLNPYPPTVNWSCRPTYGTDAGKEGECQKGDWRNIGILLVKVKDFSIRNITVRNAHCWGISLEYCRNGLVRDIQFEEKEYVMIDGYLERGLNRDGLDLRRGCRDISIENITGFSGDDLIALTAIAPVDRNREPGMYGRTEFYGAPEDVREDDVFNISINNVRGHSSGGYFVVRFLNQRGVKMYNIQLTNILDTAPEELSGFAAVKIGDPAYGGAAAPGETFNFRISGIQTHACRAVLFGAPLQDSMISDILYYQKKRSRSIFGYHGCSIRSLNRVTFNNIVSVDRTKM